MVARPSPPTLPGPEVRMARTVFPDQTNHLGSLFGGHALSMMDEACYVAATRFARRTCVTVRVDRIDFTVPVRAGELVEVVAQVVAVGRTSLTCRVDLFAEDLLGGSRRRATGGTFTLVAVDAAGRPAPVVPED
jgi:acyl-CoA hydrolase